MSSPDRVLARMAASLQAWQRALGMAAAGGAVLQVGEFVGSVVPAAASRSIVNTVAGPIGVAPRAAELAELAGGYDSAGIVKWGLWMHEDERAGQTAVEDAGLVLDSDPAAMALALADLPAPPEVEGVIVERTSDLELLAAPLSAGYGFPPALLVHGLPALLDHAEGWLARLDGVPVAGLLIVRCGDDAGVFMVATAPELRGRGAASAALHGALTRARAQGCDTSTLQSSVMGHPVYTRLGYHDLGRYLMFERRDASGGSA
ncbi:MAG: GNAT family N-acetyltransferase [Solirubrobacteraceae bacterium]